MVLDVVGHLTLDVVGHDARCGGTFDTSCGGSRSSMKQKFSMKQS